MESMEMISRKLRSSIFEVFEKMFFIFLEPAVADRNDYTCSSNITFKGIFEGKLMLSFTQSLAEMMVINLLNMEAEEINDELVSDCLKEAANMVCGNFLQKVDPALVFDLSLPSFVHRGAGDQEEIAAPETPGFLTESFTAGDQAGLRMTMTAPLLFSREESQVS